jgi:hypothetical protein
MLLANEKHVEHNWLWQTASGSNRFILQCMSVILIQIYNLNRSMCNSGAARQSCPKLLRFVCLRHYKHVIGFDTVYGKVTTLSTSVSRLPLHTPQPPPDTNSVLLLQSTRARRAARTGHVLFDAQVATPNACSRPCSYVTVAWGKLQC